MRTRLSLAIGIVLTLLACGFARTADKPETAEEILEHIHTTYYNLGDAGLRHASCYVESADALNRFSHDVRRILRQPKYVATVNHTLTFKIEPRKIPHQFGPEAREGIHWYASKMASVIKDVFAGLEAISKHANPKALHHSHDIELTTVDGQKTIQLWKKSAAQGETPVLSITIDRDNLPTEIRHWKPTGLTKTKLKSKTHDGLWLIEEAETYEYDTDDRLVKREVLAVDYTKKKKLLLPRELTYKNLDKKGKLIERRNEPNPVVIQFRDWEVEAVE